ncbi:MAG: hypothetical protein AAB662_01675 [Patescibacteria group bacterium]
MKRYRKFISAHWFGTCILLIILLSVFLRFYNYENRWGLAYDQAHDAIVARYAVENHKIPLVGPFSSAGPFQTGGEWYWFIMAATFFSPNAVITPWVALTLLYTLFVLLIIFVGKELVNEKFGLIVGLLAAVSTAQIAQATNLTNQSPLAIIALGAIWSMIIYAKTKKLKYLFLLALFVSLASTIHLQGAALIVILPITIIFKRPPFVKGIIALLLGIFIPLVPIILFDLNNNFVNSHSMLQYYLYDQYKISLDVLGRRWLTYTGVFWPNIWSHVIGGNMITGYILTIGLFFITLYSFFKKRIQGKWCILLISFLLAVIVLRYTRTPLYDSYVVFLHPFIILLTGWLIYAVYKMKKSLGVLLLIVILAGSIIKDVRQIGNAENYTDFQVKNWKKTLISQFPSSKFALYDHQYKTVNKSLPLVLYLDSDRKISDNGLRIGMTFATMSGEFKQPIIVGDKTGHQILDLSSSTSAQLKNDEWVFINPSAIYKSTEEWF